MLTETHCALFESKPLKGERFQEELWREHSLWKLHWVSFWFGYLDDTELAEEFFVSVQNLVIRSFDFDKFSADLAEE